MAKNKRYISFRTILSFLTLILVVYVIYQNWEDILETFNHLGDTNIPVLLLLIPEQLFMYYACGQIFFSYLERKSKKEFKKTDKLLVSTELNFVNHAVPAGGLGGLAYLTYRLHSFDVTAGQASFLYIFRYGVTTVINYAQALIAVVILLIIQAIPEDAMWIIPVSLLMNLGMGLILAAIIYIAISNRRIRWFAHVVSAVTNGFTRVATFGRKKSAVSKDRIEHYFNDIHESVLIVKKDLNAFKKPALWGLIYSFLEVGTYYIVALSLGRPELLPFIMVGETIGSVFDGIVPYGLYELGMAGVMIALGVDFSTATIITVMTRALTLIFTIITGAIPYFRVLQEQKKDAK